MIKIEQYKGVNITMGVVCFSLRYIVAKHHKHFADLEGAKKYIDQTLSNGQMLI